MKIDTTPSYHYHNVFAWTKVKIAEEALETATALYRGMASSGAMEDFKGEVTSTPEGKEVALLRSKPCSHLIADIKGGLQSAMSYCNRETLSSFRGNAEFGVKYSD
jgi:IMP dehydrogenase/GMP reductase